MTYKYLRHQILTLHYISQFSSTIFRQLIQLTEHKEDLLKIENNYLAKLFNSSMERVQKIKAQFYDFLSIPFEEIYTKKNYSVIVFTDENYPSSLHNLPNPPSVLYCVGDTSLFHKRKVAIIGSRDATSYTIEALKRIVPPLIQQDMVIVSGFAKGADTFAYSSALYYGGQTIAVLGSGYEHIYPKQNQQLFEQLHEGVCFVTEYPPYMEPKKWNFPMRNRIISGLSEALIVTEAAVKSGTLITTEIALEQGKDVFVVPGPIDSKFSEGTNLLIKEGAIPVWNGYQIIEELK